MWPISFLISALVMGQTSQPSNISEYPTTRLRHVGTVKLDIGRCGPEPWLILDFDIDNSGRIGFIDVGTNNKTRFLLIDDQANVLSDIPLEIDGDVHLLSTRVRWIGTGDWILFDASERIAGKQARVWRIDAIEKKAKRLEAFDCRNADALAADRNGGFVVYSAMPSDDNSFSGGEIIDFDRDGRRKRRLQLPIRGRFISLATNYLVPPQDGDITVTTDGLYVLFDLHKHCLISVDREGNYGPLIRSGEPIYCSTNYGSVTSGVHGEVIVSTYDGFGIRQLNDGEEISALDAANFWNPDGFDRQVAYGKPRSMESIKYPDGHTFRSMNSVKAAPDGGLWASDNHYFLRLDEKGKANKVLGTVLDDEFLPPDFQSRIDWNGRTYLMNSRNGTIHVFDVNGRRLHVLRSMYEDFKESGNFYFSVLPEGGVYEWQWGSSYLSYGSDGKRIGWVDPGFYGRQSYSLLFQPKGMGVWAGGANSIWLLNPKSELIDMLKKRSDGADISNVRDSGVGPDGSLAVWDSGRPVNPNARQALCMFSREGAPVHVMDFNPRHWPGLLTFNGHQAVYVSAGNRQRMMCDFEAGTLCTLDAGMNDEELSRVRPFFSMQGRELWLLNTRSLVAERFELPSRMTPAQK